MKSTELGITGTYKDEELGFTPVGKYNDSTYSFGDANYWLFDELGKDLYNKVEIAILDSLNHGINNGIMKTDAGYKVKWQLTTYGEYQRKSFEPKHNEMLDKFQEKYSFAILEDQLYNSGGNVYWSIYRTDQLSAIIYFHEAEKWTLIEDVRNSDELQDVADNYEA